MPSKYSTIEKHLLSLITKNLHIEGYKLPSENSICRMLKVSRQSCRQAITNLKNKGLVYTIRGSGTYISSDAKTILSGTKKPELNIIALILPDLYSFFMQSLIDHIEKCAYQHGLSLLLFNTQFDHKKEMECISRSLALGASGFIIYPANTSYLKETLNLLHTSGSPTVFIDTNISGKNYLSVTSKNFIALENATSQLILLGHRHIGIIGPPPKKDTSMFDRLAGYKNCLKSYRIPFHKKYVLQLSPTNTTQENIELLKEYFTKNRKISAVVGLNSSSTLLAVDALIALDKKIPDKVSVIGYEDDFAHLIKYMNIKLTAISQNIPAICDIAVNNLIKLRHGLTPEKKVIYVASQFIIRDSIKSIYK